MIGESQDDFFGFYDGKKVPAHQYFMRISSPAAGMPDVPSEIRNILNRGHAVRSSGARTHRVLLSSFRIH
jgi:hypothetical protein